MKISRLHLENFRIHGDSTLKIGDSSFVLIRGRNWAGKSTIGQALSMCLTPSTTGLDARGTGFTSKIKRGESRAVITADIRTKHHLMQRTVTLNTNQQGRVQRSICLNDPDVAVAPFEKALERQRAALTVALNSDAFLRMTEAEQKNLLAGLALPARYDFPPLVTAEVETALGPGMIDFEGEPFAVINKAYKKLFDERTVVNRQVREFAIPEALPLPAGADSASLQHELTTLRMKRREREKQHDAEVGQAIKAEGERERIRIMQQTLLPDERLTALRQVAAGKPEQDRLLKEKKRLEGEIDDHLRELGRLEEMPEGGEKCPTCGQFIDPDSLKEREAITEEALSALKGQNETLFQKIKALGDCDEAAKLIAKHEATKKELDKVENPQPVLFDFTAYNQTIAEIDAEIETLSGQLRPLIAAEERRKEIADRKKQLDVLKVRAETLDKLVKFFDKDGIKAKLLAEYIGGFEAKLNEVLGAWSYSCALSIEPYSFDVSNARGDVIPVRELSGAERVMFSLAFQCAVSRTAGIGLVVIDEVALFLPELRPVLYRRLWEMVQQGYLEQVILLVADTSEQVTSLHGSAVFLVEDGTVRLLNARPAKGAAIAEVA